MDASSMKLAFRKEERTVLLDVLNKGSFVLATGEGTPCYYDNMELMCAHGLCIYLDAAPGFLQSRLLQSKQNRPLISPYSRGGPGRIHWEAPLRTPCFLPKGPADHFSRVRVHRRTSR